MQNLSTLIQKTTAKVGETVFIAVDGHGGSGKSTLAAYLGEQLSATVIHTDDFAGWDNPLNWWPQLIETVFTPIQNGAVMLTYQPASWWENHHPDKIVDQPVTSTMILEGVSSSRKEFADFISLRIFVDTPKDICLERGVNRDAGTGKSVSELTTMWKKWIKEEEAFFLSDNPKDKADIIIDGTKTFTKQITF